MPRLLSAIDLHRVQAIDDRRRSAKSMWELREQSRQLRVQSQALRQRALRAVERARRLTS